MEPDEVRLATVDQTRPNTNLSPLHTALSGDRFQQMSDRRENLLREGAAGARKGRRYQHIAWKLNMATEHAHLAGISMSGCTADRRKFFDLLEYEVCVKLMKVLGCPRGVLYASRGYCKSATMR